VRERWRGKPEKEPPVFSFTPDPHEFFAHPERWPFKFEDGRTGACIRRVERTTADGGRIWNYLRICSDDPKLDSYADEGWESD
jgi:hypothetical protein